MFLMILFEIGVSFSIPYIHVKIDLGLLPSELLKLTIKHSFNIRCTQKSNNIILATEIENWRKYSYTYINF